MLLPVCCLAILHIAGDNVAVVPDLAGVFTDKNFYISTVYTYIMLGIILAAIIAWIGVRSGQELVVIIKDLYGARGKNIFALIILSICIPASALTGGFYSGLILQGFFSIPHGIATLITIIIFSLITAGRFHHLLLLSNYIGVLLVPIVLSLFFSQDLLFNFITPSFGRINWQLVLGLLSYNIGGMWAILVVETAAYLSKKGYKAILFVMVAKSIEGIFTLLVAYLVLSRDISGPLSLVMLVNEMCGIFMVSIFNIVLFCTFMNTMVPAMFVNSRQVSSLTGLSFLPSLFLAGVAVYIFSWMSFTTMLSIMSYAGVSMILFIVITAYYLHKYKINQQ